jgi:CheY-like chemotaxis protein
LVVDDDVIHQVGALELLETLGFETELATGGAHAVDLISRGKYALVLMDCEMPELDGYTAARRIRELAISPHLPIIACTAATSTEQRRRALDAGMEDCLKKPLQRADVCRMLAMYLPDDKNPASSGTRLTSAAAKTLRPRGAPEAEPADLAPRRRSERLVDLFVTQVPEELRELAVAADLGRPDELAGRASKLERTCVGCGAMKMAAACAALKDARTLSSEQLSARLKALNEAFVVVMRLLGETSAASENQPAPASQHNPETP